MLRRIGALGLLLLAGAWMAPLCAAPGPGKLTGVVVDPSGVPQMGASVWVQVEGARLSASTPLLTNDRGMFSAENLRPGLYSVRVTLAGFLPAFERNVRVDASLTTVLKIELDSLFTSFDRMRRKPAQELEADEWTWVLRTSSATRPVLRWVDGAVVLESEQTPAERARWQKGHGRIELTSGSRRPGSISNLPDAPSSAFAYDQRVGHGRIVFAGQVSYERSASTGFATTWIPAGEPGRGSETTLVLRQSNLGANGPAFRGVRMEHHDQLSLGRFSIRYGAEYILVGLGRSASSLRPQAEIIYQIAPRWRAGLTVASRPWSGVEPRGNVLESGITQLDGFPSVLVRNGRPVLAGGWHEEFSFERLIGANGSVVTSVFRDRSSHTAVFGRGGAEQPEFFQDFYSNAFSYDGGGLNSFGTRVAYRQKFCAGAELTVIYSYAGALLPATPNPSLALRDELETRGTHSVAARVSTRISRTHTSLSASYKWIRGPVVSRQDPYGEIAYQVDPFLNLSVRQPLPTFFFPGKLEALADFRNLMAQGYVPVSSAEGQVVLVPSFRSFRGGFSFQF